ncbi:MAG: hypothetical protein MRECE_30c014 [Mycoplasmataceae bacterium CE_OT135]|nr:MAG: hypothetical protein MRECE_30c014 [Mycoplasmataceae bacterium CE_OT135]
MVNAMEWLHSQEEYNTKEKREKIKRLNIKYKKLEGHLDLREFVNLKELTCSDNQLTSLDLSVCSELTRLDCYYNKLTSVDFLKTLHQPEKLAWLSIFNNNIQPTDIAIFKPFVNLECLKLGTMEGDLKWWGKHNKFYGSFQSWKDLSKLKSICIEATDINEGLEYLPFSLAQATRGGNNYRKIECSPCSANAKCSQIQDQLRPFNYDLEAWQLAHPELMLKARPEYFINPDSREQWIIALKNKIQSSQEALNYLMANETDSTAKIIRLETQIKILEETENQLREEMEQEREIHQDSLKAMDNFYQQNPPKEEQRLNNILKVFEKDYLKLNRENQIKEQKNQELERTIELIEKLAQQRIQELESKITQLESQQNQTTRTEIVAPRTNNN